jgi:amidase
MQRYLAELIGSPIRSIEDIIRYNLDSVVVEGGLPGVQPAFAGGQNCFYESLETRGIEDDTYKTALSFMRSTSQRGIDAPLRDQNLDALLVPSHFRPGHSVAAQAGYPAITIPAGADTKNAGVPFGLLLMGTAWDEGNLVRWAGAIEDAMRRERRSRPLPEWRDHRRRILPIVFD